MLTHPVSDEAGAAVSQPSGTGAAPERHWIDRRDHDARIFATSFDGKACERHRSVP
jgi:hypothetical protein